MRTVHNDHLSDIQMYQMLLDPSDLLESGNAHLSACSRCRTALDALRDELQTVGDLSRATTPKPMGKLRLPARQSRNPYTIIIGLRPFPRLLVSALALVLVIGAAVWVINHSRTNRTAYEAGQTLNPDQLLSEIDALVETPFASEFLLTTSGNEVDADEDFMEYIVPVIENDPMTRITGKKGESRC